MTGSLDADGIERAWILLVLVAMGAGGLFVSKWLVLVPWLLICSEGMTFRWA